MGIALYVGLWFAAGYLAMWLRAAGGDMTPEIAAASFLCGPLSLAIFGLAAIAAHGVLVSQKESTPPVGERER